MTSRHPNFTVGVGALTYPQAGAVKLPLAHEDLGHFCWGVGFC